MNALKLMIIVSGLILLSCNGNASDDMDTATENGKLHEEEPGMMHGTTNNANVFSSDSVNNISRPDSANSTLNNDTAEKAR